MSTLFLGDCLDVMRKMDADSIDAIVTDPPYGLAFMGEKWDNFGGKSCGNDSAEVRRQKAEEYAEKNSGAPRYANGHGGAPTLDSMRSFQSAMTPIFAEALRVAKPGAHLLAFGGTRTYHRLACAIEDAGWEIRDCIMWVYGSGFPKSMDIAKAIDNSKGLKGEKIGERRFGKTSTGQASGWHVNHVAETGKQDVLAPASDEAKQWNGWGTCLKPAVEPIVVARKPLEGTVAANVLKYGTGAINIDGCRIGIRKRHPGNYICNDNAVVLSMGKRDRSSFNANQGRYPANLIHDGSDEVLALFPDTGKSGVAVRHNSGGCTFGGNIKKPPMHDMSYSDSGSAARFFYCAKASRKERGEGNIHPTVKPLALMRYLVRLVTRKGGIVLDPFMGSGTTGVAAIQEGMNFVGIERDPHYFDIAKSRVNAAKPIPPTTTQQELPLCE